MPQLQPSAVRRPRSAAGLNGGSSPRSVPMRSDDAFGSSPRSSGYPVSTRRVDLLTTIVLAILVIELYWVASLIAPSWWSIGLVVAAWVTIWLVARFVWGWR